MRCFGVFCGVGVLCFVGVRGLFGEQGLYSVHVATRDDVGGRNQLMEWSIVLACGFE